MQIAHEFMAQSFQHMAQLHAEVARMQAEILTLTQDNVRLTRCLGQREAGQHVKGTESLHAPDATGDAL